MGQAVFAEHCNYCCCCDQPDTEITNEIKLKPKKKNRKPKPKLTTNIKSPILKQSISDNSNVAFATLEDAHPSESDHTYSNEQCKEITDSNRHKLNQILNTVPVINAPHETQETTVAYLYKSIFETTHRIFIQMDTAIGKYYQQNNIDNYYTENNKHGKFLKYVTTNNCNPNEIQSQFAEHMTANNCKYIQFDYDNFPINNNTNISKDEQIFNVLKHCYTFGEAPDKNTINAPTDTHVTVKSLHMIENSNDDEESLSLSNSVSDTIQLHHEIQSSDQYEYESEEEQNNLISKADDVAVYNEFDKNEASTHGYSGQHSEYNTNITTSNDKNEISNDNNGTVTPKIIIEEMTALSTITAQSVDSYVKQKQSDTQQVSDSTNETRNRANTHKILIQPPLSNVTAQSVDSYMQQKENSNDKRMDVHAKYDRDLYLKREIGKLDTGIWEGHIGNNDAHLEHGPDKVLNEDTSWVKTARRVSYHSPHESLAKLQLKKVVSTGKLFETLLAPIDDEPNVLNRNDRAYSMPVKQ